MNHLLLILSGTGETTDKSKLVTRKNVDHLTREEMFELREAFDRWQHDKSVDGFQAIAEYHGLPARCPSPNAEVRWACCHHGMATFPHWHRLFVTQVKGGNSNRKTKQLNVLCKYVK